MGRKESNQTNKLWTATYFKFRHFREGFIFAERRGWEVSWHYNLREMAELLCRLLM